MSSLVILVKNHSGFGHVASVTRIGSHSYLFSRRIQPASKPDNFTDIRDLTQSSRVQ